MTVTICFQLFTTQTQTDMDEVREKKGARELGAVLLQISEQATDLVDEIADKHKEVTKK